MHTGSDDSLHAIIEHCPLALSLHRSDGSFLYAAPACVSLYGAETAALFETTLMSAILAADRELFADGWNRVIVRGESLDCRCRLESGATVDFTLGPAGTTPHDGAKVVCAARAIAVTATEPQASSEHANDALARAHRDVLVGLLPGLVWYGPVTPDLSSYKLSYMSEYLFEVTGYSAEEWFSTPGFWRDRIHPSDRTELLESTAQMLRGDREAGPPYRFRAADGRYLWLQSSMRIERDEAGDPSRMFGLTLDVTELMESREQAQVLEREVETIAREILELSAPLIPVGDGILVLPLIGTIDPSRARHALESLLTGIKRYEASAVIIDLTGVALADTSSVAALTRAAQAVKLLGATPAITGIGSRMALTILEAGLLDNGVTIYAAVADAVTALKRRPRRRRRPASRRGKIQ